MTLEQSLLDYIPHAGVLVDRVGRILAANDAFQRQFGQASMGESILTVLGRGPLSAWADQMPPDWDTFRDQLETGVVYDDVRLRLTAVDDHRDVLLCIGTTTDEQQRSLGAIRHQRALFSALLRAMDHAVFVVDQQGVVLEYNETARAVVSTDDHVLAGREIDRVLSIRQTGTDISPRALIKRARQRGQELRFTADLHVVTRLSGPIAAEIDVFPLQTPAPARELPSDDALGAVVVVRDVEETRRVQRERRIMQHAENVTRAATGLAHELANACTALFGQVDLLYEQTGEDPAQLAASVRRIQRLTYRFRGFSGSSAGSGDNAVPKTGQIDAEHVEETIINAVDLALSGTSIRATFQIDSSVAPVTIPVDQLSQVLFNVVTNAMDAMTEGGIVHVEAAAVESGRELCIVVRDEGHGMDPRTLQDIFTPYFTTKDQGIGMGLPVSVSMVQACGGRMDVQTEPGYGTTVQIYLPFLPDTPSSHAGEDPSMQIPPPERKEIDFSHLHVLLVEDDPLVRQSMERNLHALGCTVTALENGDRALPEVRRRLAEGTVFQLLIADHTLPGRIDGVQLLHRIRELAPDLPAIVSSGAIQRFSDGRYRQLGFQATLRKPFGAHRLTNAIRDALQESRFDAT